MYFSTIQNWTKEIFSNLDLYSDFQWERVRISPKLMWYRPQASETWWESRWGSKEEIHRSWKVILLMDKRISSLRNYRHSTAPSPSPCFLGSQPTITQSSTSEERRIHREEMLEEDTESRRYIGWRWKAYIKLIIVTRLRSVSAGANTFFPAS